MTLRFKSIVCVFLLICSSTTFSDDGTSIPSNSGSDDSGGSPSLPPVGGSGDDLKTYLKNLGKYFGYDITQYCKSGGTCNNDTGKNDTFSNFLISKNDVLAPQLNLYNSYLGALTGTPSSGTGATSSTALVPPNLQNYVMLNTLATQTFNNPSYASPSQSTVSVTQNVDQTTYQQDPVGQTLLNLMGTPSNSYCQSNDESMWLTSCNLLYRDKVLTSAIGTIPKTDDYFTYDYLQTYLTQVNSNTLVTPLLYNTSPDNSATSTSSGTNTSGTNQGLIAETQAQEVANFVRYASGTMVPPALPSRSDYDALYSAANNLSGKTDQKTQRQSQGILANYFIQLRTYAAQVSVGVSNLYYIMSKRLPQSTGGSNSQPTSQALNEFNMATWRLFNPNDSSSNEDTQWVNKINKASTATVQKEIAILLAEINYQLYMTRQQQERQLLTESIMLLQNSRLTQPQPTLNPESSAQPLANLKPMQ